MYAEIRVGEIEIVVGSEFAARGVEQRQHRIGVFLQVVNLVLNTGAQHLEGQRLAGFNMKFEVIDIFRDLNAAVDNAGHWDGIGLVARVIVAALAHHRMFANDQLADAGNAQRRGDAELAHAQRCVVGDRHA